MPGCQKEFIPARLVLDFSWGLPYLRLSSSQAGFCIFCFPNHICGSFLRFYPGQKCFYELVAPLKLREELDCFCENSGVLPLMDWRSCSWLCSRRTYIWLLRMFRSPV